MAFLEIFGKLARILTNLLAITTQYKDSMALERNGQLNENGGVLVSKSSSPFHSTFPLFDNP